MKAKPFPAKCADCRHSEPEKNFDWNNRCHHPIVNARDPHALARNGGSWAGTDCHDERGKKWFAKCGMKGKLWEPR